MLYYQDISGFNVKKTGTAFNPNTELVFEKVAMRSFDFNFDDDTKRCK